MDNGTSKYLYENHANGFEFGGMCSFVNAIADKRKAFFISDWWGMELGVGGQKNFSNNRWLDIRFEFGPKIGCMLGDNGDVFYRLGWLTGNNSVKGGTFSGSGAYDAIFMAAGANLPFCRFEAGFGRNGTVETRFKYFMLDGAIHIGHAGYWGVKYETFPYKEYAKAAVRNIRTYFSIFY
jgi:hypothetical protein